MSIFFVNTQDAQISNAFLATLGAAPGSTYLAQVKTFGLVPSVQAMINATGSSTAAALSTKVATNLGLTGSALTGGTAYLSSVTFAGSSSAWAANLMETLNLFSTLQSDATYGSAATAYLARVNSAVSYSSVAANNSTDLSTLAAAVGSAGSTGSGSTFTLTIGSVTGRPDSFVGTSANDTFNALANNSLENGDVLVGGLGVDTLNFFLAGATDGAAATIAPDVSGIEIVNARYNFGANTTFNAANFSGLTKVIADRPLDSDGGTDDILTITGISTSVTVGASGAVAAASRAIVDYEFSSVAGLADRATAEFTAASVASVVFDGIETLNITVGAGTTTIEDTLDAEEATSIVISGSGNLVLGERDAESSGAGGNSTNVDAVISYTFDASALTGNLTLIGTEDAGTVVIRGGAGDDVIYISTDFDTGYTISGGAGTDTIRMADGADLTALSGVKVTDFEVLELSDGTGTYDLDFLPGIERIQLTNFTTVGAVVADEIAVGVGALISITAANATTFSQKGDADAGRVNDTFTVTIGGTAAVDLPDLIISDIETVNVISIGSAINIVEVLEASAATSVNFSGSQGVTVTLATNTIAARSIDASAMTGAFGVEFNATVGSGGADLYLGSAGVDKIFTSEGADVVQTGGGADVIIVFDALNDAPVFRFVSALDSAGDNFDVIDLTNGATVVEGEGFLLDFKAFGFTGAGITAIKSHTTTVAGATAEVTDFASADIADFFNDSGVDRRVAIEFDTDAGAITRTVGSGAFEALAIGGDAAAVYVDVDGNGDYEHGTDMKIIIIAADLNGLDAAADYIFA